MSIEDQTPDLPEDAAIEKYHEVTTVNGIEMSVGWDRGYDDFTIYFPQIPFGEEADEQGVHDQVIRLTRQPEVAKQIFEYAVAQAQRTSNIFELYKDVEAYARELPYDTDED